MQDHWIIAQKLLNHCSSPMFALDGNGCYTIFNHRHAQFMQTRYGSSIEIGANWLEAITDSEDRAKARQSLERALAGEEFTELAFLGGGILPRQPMALHYIPQSEPAGALVIAEAATQEVYQRLLNHAGSIILFVDPQTTAILDANATACQFYGYSYAELLQMRIIDLAAAPEELVWEGFKKVLSGERKTFQGVHRLANGEIRQIEVHPEPVEIYGQAMVLGVVHDITERKQAERKLREAEYQYRMLAENSPDTIYVMDLAKYKTIYLNRETLFGYTLEELEASGSILSKVHPDDLPGLQSHWQRALKGEPQEACEYRLQAKDGRWVWISSRESILARDENGKPAQLLVTLSQITEQKRARQEFELFFNMIPDLVCIASSDGYFKQLNQEWERALGYTQEELLASPLAEFIHPEDVEATFKEIERQIAGHSTIHFTNRYRAKDGVDHWFEWNGIPSPDGVSLYAAARDITEHKRIQHSLAESEKHFKDLYLQQKIAEAALRESEARFNRTLRASPIGIGIFRIADNRSTDINDALLDLLGCSREEALGRTSDELKIFPKSGQKARWNQTLLQEGIIRRSEAVIHRNSGEIRYVMFSAMVFEMQAEPLVMILTSDITELKHLEASLLLAQTELEKRVAERTAELNHSNQILELFVAYAPAAIAMFDREMNYLAVSQRFLSDYHISGQNIIGRSHYDVFPEISETWKAIHRRCLAGAVEKCEEEPFLRADGSLDWVRWEIHPWYESPTQVGGILLFSELITERKTAESALQESQKKLRMAIQSANVGLWDWDLGTNQVYYSPEYKRILGYTEEEFSNDFSEWESRVHPDDLSPTNARLATFLRNPSEGYWAEFRMRHKDGGYRWILAQAAVLTDAQGQAARMLGSHIDITGSKKAERSLQETSEKLRTTNILLEKALKAKDEFMAAMSHEMRTPLTGILGLSEVLQLQTYGPLSDKQIKAIMSIESSGQRLLSLVNDVLDFTQIQSGTMRLRLTPCSLTELCQTSLRKVQSKAEAKRQQIQLKLPTKSVQIQADARYFQQMLANLLENAVKFTAAGGVITLAAAGLSAQKQVRISISDTGIGIQEEDFPRLFQPFIQLDASLSRMYEGTGLGLAIVKGLAELHGGSVSVESVFGQGSTFTVTLPWPGA